MTATLYVLVGALVAAGAAAIAGWIRVSGVKDKLKAAELLAAAEHTVVETKVAELATAHEEVRQLRARAAVLDRGRRIEIEELEAMAARCADAHELRQWLQRVTSSPAVKS